VSARSEGGITPNLPCVPHRPDYGPRKGLPAGKGERLSGRGSSRGRRSPPRGRRRCRGGHHFDASHGVGRGVLEAGDGAAFSEEVARPPRRARRRRGAALRPGLRERASTRIHALGRAHEARPPISWTFRSDGSYLHGLPNAARRSGSGSSRLNAAQATDPPASRAAPVSFVDGTALADSSAGFLFRRRQGRISNGGKWMKRYVAVALGCCSSQRRGFAQIRAGKYLRERHGRSSGVLPGSRSRCPATSERGPPSPPRRASSASSPRPGTVHDHASLAGFGTVGARGGRHHRRNVNLDFTLRSQRPGDGGVMGETSAGRRQKRAPRPP